jgi:hypothetical protein
MTLYQRWLEQLIKWSEAGSKSHAWHQARELAKNPMFAELPNDLTKAMQSRPKRR